MLQGLRGLLSTVKVEKIRLQKSFPPQVGIIGQHVFRDFRTRRRIV